MEPQLSSTIQAWWQTKPGTIQAWFQRKPAAILINQENFFQNKVPIFLDLFTHGPFVHHFHQIFPGFLPTCCTSFKRCCTDKLFPPLMSFPPRHHLREDPCPTGKHHLTGTLLFKMPNKKIHSNDLIKKIFS